MAKIGPGVGGLGQNRGDKTPKIQQTGWWLFWLLCVTDVNAVWGRLASALIWPCVPHRFLCGDFVGCKGHQEFVWRRGYVHFLRQRVFNDVIGHILFKSDVLCTKELLDLFRSDGKRADSSTLKVWMGQLFMMFLRFRVLLDGCTNCSLSKWVYLVYRL